MPTVLVATIQTKPGREAEFEAAARTCIAATHTEPGNHLYALHVSKQDPTQFVFVEKWEDGAALKAHSTSPHMADFGAAIGDLLVAPPTLFITNPIPAGDPAKGEL